MINCNFLTAEEEGGVNQRQQKEPKMGAIKKGQGQKTVKKAKFTNMLTQT